MMVIRLGTPVVLAIPLYKFLYRISWGLSIGVSILIAVLTIIVVYGLTFAAAILWAIHPAVLFIGIVCGFAVPLLLWHRDYRLKKRFDAGESVWGSAVGSAGRVEGMPDSAPQRK